MAVLHNARAPVPTGGTGRPYRERRYEWWYECERFALRFALSTGQKYGVGCVRWCHVYRTGRPVPCPCEQVPGGTSSVLADILVYKERCPCMSGPMSGSRVRVPSVTPLVLGNVLSLLVLMGLSIHSWVRMPVLGTLFAYV